MLSPWAGTRADEGGVPFWLSGIPIGGGPKK